MSTIIVVREISSRSLNTELLKPDVGASDAADAACIARAIAERMDPEWREFIAQEQFDRMVASFEPLGEAVAAIAEDDCLTTA
jgi:hypothetical protein